MHSDKKTLIKEYIPVTPDEDFPSTVTVLKGANGAMVYLVGTAHFSEESQDDVSKVCTNRAQIFKNFSYWKTYDDWL